jgi:hypothetical protein
MCMRNVLAAVLGAAVVFAWTCASWMLMPWHKIDMQSFKDDGKAMVEVIKRDAPDSGIYILPNMSKDMYKSPEKQAEWTKNAKAGPYVFMSVKSSGLGWDMHMSLIGQYVIQLIVAFFAAWLLSKSALSNVFKRAIFVSCAVTIGVILSEAANYNWWGFPLRSMGINIADALIGWFFAGIIMAMIVKKQKA